MENAQRCYLAWLNDILVDDDTKCELNGISGNNAEIYDRFFKQLEFGTGGLRGLIGAGMNRMNVYTVRLATQALAEHILLKNKDSRGVVIAHDPRNKSQEFVLEAAKVLVGNQIPVFVFPRVTPTPLLSYAVRYCSADAGIMITASHNTREYNGYKAYGSDGVQLLPDPSNEVSRIMMGLTQQDVKIAQEPKNSSLWTWLDDQVYESYYEQVTKLAPATKEQDLDISILFTPLHGAGGQFVSRALKNAGFTHLDIVEEQLLPDGNFPTVALPNPEEPDAFALAFKYAKKKHYDLVLATDPDADRVGVAVNVDGHFVLLTGNQVGVLLSDYLLLQLEPDQRKNKVLIKTIVSTPMIDAIGVKYGVEILDTLTGFKFIGSYIELLEGMGKEFLFGFEESCGYLAGTFVRDKDAIVACLLIAQMTAFYKKQGITLAQRLDELMEEYGYYLESMSSYYFENASEAEQANTLIAALRMSPPHEIGGYEIKTCFDYLNSVAHDVVTNTMSKLDFPQENVLQWETVIGDKITLRPSGTEPKMKLYVAVKAENQSLAELKLTKIIEACDQLVNNGLVSVG